jgi:hypothetical protein
LRFGVATGIRVDTDETGGVKQSEITSPIGSASPTSQCRWF